jgi:hypothetical protein
VRPEELPREARPTSVDASDEDVGLRHRRILVRPE